MVIYYLLDVSHLIKAFMTPLREEKIFDGKMEREILPREEIPRIFCNIELILSINTELASKLEKSLTASESGALVETFAALVSSLCSVM